MICKYWDGLSLFCNKIYHISEDGNLSVTMHVLTAVFNHFYLAQVTYKDQKGWPALHAFFTRYNVGLNFPQFFEKMIDHPANLREIIEMEFPAINSELNKMGI